MSEFASLLTVEAMSLVDEQPPLWEFRLYARVLIDEIARNRMLPAVPVGTAPSPAEFEDGTAWLSSRLEVLDRVVENASSLINSDHEDAWGAPGQDGNADAIVRFALQMAAFHRQAMDWGNALRQVSLHPLLQPCAREASVFVDAVVLPIEGQGPRILDQCDGILAAPPGTPATLDASMVFEDFDRSRFTAACEAAAQSRRLR